MGTRSLVITSLAFLWVSLLSVEVNAYAGRTAATDAMRANGRGTAESFKRGEELDKYCKKLKQAKAKAPPHQKPEIEKKLKECEEKRDQADQQGQQGAMQMPQMAGNQGDQSPSTPGSEFADFSSKSPKEVSEFFGTPEGRRVLKGTGLSASDTSAVRRGLARAAANGVAPGALAAVAPSTGSLGFGGGGSIGGGGGAGLAALGGSGLGKDDYEKEEEHEPLDSPPAIFGGGGAGGGGGGKKGYGLVDVPDFEDDYRKNVKSVNPSAGREIASLSSNFAGGRIGIASDSIFKMVSRRYKKMHRLGAFLP